MYTNQKKEADNINIRNRCMMTAFYQFNCKYCQAASMQIMYAINEAPPSEGVRQLPVNVPLRQAFASHSKCGSLPFFH